MVHSKNLGRGKIGPFCPPPLPTGAEVWKSHSLVTDGKSGSWVFWLGFWKSGAGPIWSEFFRLGQLVSKTFPKTPKCKIFDGFCRLFLKIWNGCHVLYMFAWHVCTVFVFAPDRPTHKRHVRRVQAPQIFSKLTNDFWLEISYHEAKKGPQSLQNRPKIQYKKFFKCL